MKISLRGTPKYYDNQKTFSIEGIYDLYQTSVNGYPAWIQESRKHALWFDKFPSTWLIGDFENIGGNNGYIGGPFGHDEMPSTIKKKWRYYEYGNWPEVDDKNDVKILAWTRRGNYCNVTF